MTVNAPIWISAPEIHKRLSPSAAVGELARAVSAGLRADQDPARMSLVGDSSELLVMPAHDHGWFGTKLVTVSPEDAAGNIPRIQGGYLLFDAATASPAALIEAVALTEIRTAAVSMLAVRDRLRALGDDVRVVVFGAGVQASAHIEALREQLPGKRLEVTAVSRSGRRLSERANPVVSIMADDVQEVRSVLRDADVVVCATTASQPLFSVGDISAGATVIAVGSHHADRRELPGGIFSGSQVVVESRETALREAGDVVLAIDEGLLNMSDLVTLDTIVLGHTPVAGGDRTYIFKSVGMAWQDLVLARFIYQQVSRGA